jgi:hypothetical protein
MRAGVVLLVGLVGCYSEDFSVTLCEVVARSPEVIDLSNDDPVDVRIDVACDADQIPLGDWALQIDNNSPLSTSVPLAADNAEGPAYVVTGSVAKIHFTRGTLILRAASGNGDIGAIDVFDWPVTGAP